MPKRFKMKVECEIVLDEDWYIEGTVEDMIATEKANFDNDPSDFLAMLAEQNDLKFQMEYINEE